MTRIASVDLVFNAKDKSGEAFRSLNKGLADTQKTTKVTLTQFEELGVEIKKLGQDSLQKLKQGFISVQVSVNSFTSGASEAFVNLSRSILFTAKVAGQFASIAGVGISTLNRAAQGLGANNAFELVGNQIEQATQEARSFAEVLPELGKVTKTVSSILSNFSLRKTGEAIKEYGQDIFGSKEKGKAKKPKDLASLLIGSGNLGLGILQRNLEGQLRSVLPKNAIGNVLATSATTFLSSIRKLTKDSLTKAVKEGTTSSANLNDIQAVLGQAISGIVGGAKANKPPENELEQFLSRGVRREPVKKAADSVNFKAFEKVLGKAISDTVGGTLSSVLGESLIGKALSKASTGKATTPQEKAIGQLIEASLKGFNKASIGTIFKSALTGKFEFKDAFKLVESAAKAGIAEIPNIGVGLANGLIEQGKNIDSTNVVQAGIQSFASALPDGIAEDLFKKLSIEGARAFSPEVLEKLGKTAVETIFPKLPEGIGKAFPFLTASFSSFAESIFSAISKAGGKAGADVAASFVKEIPNALTPIEKLRRQIDNLGTSARNIGTSLKDAFAPKNIGRTLDTLQVANRKIIEVPNQIGASFVALGGVLQAAAGYDEALAVFDGLKQSASAFSETVGNISQQIFFFQSAFQSIGQIVATGPFKLLIGQQIELRQQLLETQSTLVATNRIIDNSTGRQLNLPVEEGGDPAQAIISLSGATSAAIDQLRRDSLQLVGVTSRELAEVFNITVTNLASIGIATDNILGDAADLTIKFAAALGTIGLPLFQARQEISSILQGTIDQNSALAKTLNLSSAQVQQYKDQGVLLERLNSKLAAFKAGNAIAAKSFSGVTSNLQEILEVVSLRAGKPLLDPLLEGLNRFYQFLASKQNAFARFLEPVIQDFLRIQQAVFSLGEAIGTSLGAVFADIPAGIINSIANFIEQVASAIKNALVVLEPFFAVLKGLTGLFTGLTNFFGATVVQLITIGKVIQVTSGAFNLFLNLLTGVGEARFVLENGTRGIISQLTNIRGEFGTTTTAALSFGLNFQKINGIFPQLGQSLTRSLGPLSFLGPAMIAAVPKVSLLFIALSRIPSILTFLSKKFLDAIPPLRAFITSSAVASRIISILAGKILALALVVKTALSDAGLGSVGAKFDGFINALQRIEQTGGKKGLFLLGKQFSNLGVAAEEALGKTSKVAEGFAKNIFGDLSKSAIKGAITFGLWSIAIVGAGVALSEFLQRRKDAGKEIRLSTQELEQQANALSGLYKVGGNFQENNKALRDGSKLTKDWVDKIILFDRNFRLADLSFKNFGETILSIGKAIGIFFSRLAATIAATIQLIVTTIQGASNSIAQIAITFGDFFKTLTGIIFKTIRGDVMGASNDAKAFIERTIISFKDLMTGNFEGAKDSVKGIWDAILNGFGGTKTKVEDEVQDIASAILDPKYLASAKKYGKEIRDVLIPKDSEFKGIGESLSKTISVIANGSTSAADRLGAISDAIRLVKEAGKTGIIDEAAVADSLQYIEDFKTKSLRSQGELVDSSEEGQKAFEEQADALRQALNLGLSQGRNINLEKRADFTQKQIDVADDYLKKMQEMQQAGLQEVEITLPNGEKTKVQIGAVIDQARRVKAELEGSAKVISDLRQDTTPLPDPVQLYTSALQRGEKRLKREQGKLTLEQQQDTQETIFNFLEKRKSGELVFARQLEADKAAIQKRAIQEELKDITEAVADIDKIRSTLTKSELERAEEQEDQYIQLKTRQAQKEVELYEAVLSEQQRQREEAERLIQDTLKVAQNAIQSQTLSLQEQQQEYDKINKLIEFQGQLLSENQKFTEAQADAAVSGLEFLAKTSRGQLRQKEFAEAQAVIRLKAVEQQVKFEQISLKFEQEKTRLTLERQAAEAKIADINADKAVVEAKAELAKTKLNPEATAAEIKGAELGLQAALLGKQASQQGLRLVALQQQQLPILQALERQRAEVQQRNKLITARQQRVEAIPETGKKRQAEKRLQQEIVDTVLPSIGINAADINEAFRQVRGANDADLRDRGLLTQEIVPFLSQLEALVPSLADLTGEARDQAIDKALRKYVQAGGFEGEGNPLAPTTVPAQGFTLQFAQPTILQQAFAPVQNTLGIAAEGLGKATQGFNTLVTELKALATKPTYAITVTANGKAATANGVAANGTPDLERLLTAAKRLAAQGF